jgi:hypothetical protein
MRSSYEHSSWASQPGLPSCLLSLFEGRKADGKRSSAGLRCRRLGGQCDPFHSPCTQGGVCGWPSSFVTYLDLFYVVLRARSGCPKLIQNNKLTVTSLRNRSWTLTNQPSVWILTPHWGIASRPHEKGKDFFNLSGGLHHHRQSAGYPNDRWILYRRHSGIFPSMHRVRRVVFAALMKSGGVSNTIDRQAPPGSKPSTAVIQPPCATFP